MLPPQLQPLAPNPLTPHYWFNTSRKAGPGSTALWRSLIGFWIGTCVRTQDLLRGQTDIMMLRDARAGRSELLAQGVKSKHRSSKRTTRLCIRSNSNYFTGWFQDSYRSNTVRHCHSLVVCRTAAAERNCDFRMIQSIH